MPFLVGVKKTNKPRKQKKIKKPNHEKKLIRIF